MLSKVCSKTVPLLENVEKTWHTWIGHRWRYGAWALHCGYLRLQSNSQSMWYFLLFHGNNGYANAPQCMSPVLLQSLTRASHVDSRPLPLTVVLSPQDRQRIGFWPRWWKNSDPAEEPNSSSSPQAFISLPAPTRFQIPPVGGDGQCDKTLKNAKRLDGWRNKRAVFWVE